MARGLRITETFQWLSTRTVDTRAVFENYDYVIITSTSAFNPIMSLFFFLESSQRQNNSLLLMGSAHPEDCREILLASIRLNYIKL